MKTENGFRGFPGAAAFLIVLGIFLLIFNLSTEMHFWWVLAHYWPVILILVGIGRLWDYYWPRSHPEYSARGVGVSAAWIAVLIVFGILMFHTRGMARNSSTSTPGAMKHETKTVELQGVKAVSANLQMPAGELDIHGGSTDLLNATFDHTGSEGTPQVVYSTNGDHGNLTIVQTGTQDIHIGNSENNWSLQFGNTVPIDMTLNMGASQGNLNLRDVELAGLTINLGAGQLDVNLTGDRKANLPVQIHGGVGQATIHLPKNVGVLVHAHGGIGSIDTQGLIHEGDEYHNNAYEKSPVTINMTVEGGIGQIELKAEE